MRITVLGSGSQGNATLIEGAASAVLIDAGLSPQTLKRRYQRVTRAPWPVLDAVVITHPHDDHARHAVSCAQHFDAPLYLTRSTERRLPAGDDVRTRVFGPSTPFRVRSLELHPCPVPHDAPQVALVVGEGASRAALVTDLGEVPVALGDHLQQCSAVLIESNHDPDMLQAGPYPERLKRRIASDQGHLSNQQTAELLSNLQAHTKTVVLMHLSRVNNRPELAMTQARRALKRRRTRVMVADQYRPLKLEVGPTHFRPTQLSLIMG